MIRSTVHAGEPDACTDISVSNPHAPLGNRRGNGRKEYMTNMKIRCRDCNKEIQSDGKQAVEIWWKLWQSNLSRNEFVKIICLDCFKKYGTMGIDFIK